MLTKGHDVQLMKGNIMNIKELAVNEALELVRTRQSPAVSIYLGTDVKDNDPQNTIKANLQRLYRIAEYLVSRTYDTKTKDRLLLPLKRVLSTLKLNQGKGGVAIYHNENFTGVVKLPTPVKDLAVAADSFHIKPVLRCVQLRRAYLVLAFKRKYAELIAVNADGARLIERFDTTMYTQEPNPKTNGYWRKAAFSLKNRRNKVIKHAMHILNRQLDSYWHGERRVLLLVGPKKYQDAFRSSCNYMHLLEKGITGHLDDMSIHALAKHSANMLTQYFAQYDLAAIDMYNKAQASGLATTNLRMIAEAAAHGQINSLFIAEDQHIWGQLDRESGNITLMNQKGDAHTDDLLDDIAELVLLKGGKVTVLPTSQMPDQLAIAAVLRWAPTSTNSMPAVQQIVHSKLPAMRAANI